MGSLLPFSAPPPPRRSIFADKLREFADFAFGDERVFQNRGRWRDFFGQRIGPSFAGRIIFEVGCADAAFLSRIAIRHPDVAFVGLDWKCRALHAGAGRVAELGLRNVALLRGRAQDVLRLFADGELDEIWVFHPDPCATPAERRNRLIAEPFLLDAHRALGAPASVLALKTDHPGYYQSTLALLGLPEPPWFQPAREIAALQEAARADARSAAPRDRAVQSSPRVKAREVTGPEELPPPSEAFRSRFHVSANSVDYWNDPAALARTAGRCFAGETTFFEGRFLKRRLPIYYVEISKK